MVVGLNIRFRLCMSLFLIFSVLRCHLLSIPHCNTCVRDCAQAFAQIRLNTQRPNDIICGISKATKLNTIRIRTLASLSISITHTHIHSLFTLEFECLQADIEQWLLLFFVSLLPSSFFFGRSFVGYGWFTFLMFILCCLLFEESLFLAITKNSCTLRQ